MTISAEVRLPTADLRADLRFFTEVLRMRLDMIYPADNPSVVVLAGHGLRIRLQKDAPEAPGTIRILADDPDGFAEGKRNLVAPNGTRVEIEESESPLVCPPTQHAYVVKRLADQEPWVIGRAGMNYRDLLPQRLGGAIIASHIRIPEGGPVADMVHYHKIGFQLIFCYRGWVDVLYEDQGAAIRLTAGDCFTQPPEIRHRVVEASAGVEVIEIGVPAEHLTCIDHELTLPNDKLDPDREWDGQRFVHNVAANATWSPFRVPGLIARDTTISENSGGVASVQVARRGDGDVPWASHDADILFGFVMEGAVTLEGVGQDSSALTSGDAFAIPPGMKTRFAEPSDDFELLEVSLPGHFSTQLS